MTADKRIITVYDCTCKRCGHTWTTKTDELPGTCPNPSCRSRYWNREKTNRPSKGKETK